MCSRETMALTYWWDAGRRRQEADAIRRPFVEQFPDVLPFWPGYQGYHMGSG